MRAALALLLVAAPAVAGPAHPNAVIDARVTAIGPVPMAFACGFFMSTQSMTLEVTKVDSGPVTKGDRLAVAVMTCGAGPLLTLSDPKRPVGWMLDPAQIRAGSELHLDVENLDARKAYWFTTTDRIAVTKR